jgi:hypothetical protein
MEQTGLLSWTWGKVTEHCAMKMYTGRGGNAPRILVLAAVESEWSALCCSRFCIETPGTSGRRLVCPRAGLQNGDEDRNPCRESNTSSQSSHIHFVLCNFIAKTFFCFVTVGTLRSSGLYTTVAFLSFFSCWSVTNPPVRCWSSLWPVRPVGRSTYQYTPGDWGFIGAGNPSSYSCRHFLSASCSIGCIMSFNAMFQTLLPL